MPYDDIFRRYLKPMAPIPTRLSASGGLNQPVRAVLFDVYGTLFLSGSGDIGSTGKTIGSASVLEELIRSYNISCSSKTLIRIFFDTIRAVHARMKSEGVDYPEVRVERIWTEVLGLADPETIRRFALSFELITSPVWPMPHLEELLAACRGSGLTLGIISNAQFYTPLLFNYFCGAPPEHLGFDPELIVYSCAVGRAKPSPVLFDTVAKRLGRRRIAPENTLYIGNDMRNDIQPARAEGFQTALFAGDARSLRLRSDDPCCKILVPDLCITDLEQLSVYIGKSGMAR